MDIHSMFDVVSYSEQTFLTIYSRLGLCFKCFTFLQFSLLELLREPVLKNNP